MYNWLSRLLKRIWFFTENDVTAYFYEREKKKKILCFTSLLSGNAGSGLGSFCLFFSILETFVFAVGSRSEVSDSRVPMEMVYIKTEYNLHKWQVWQWHPVHSYCHLSHQTPLTLFHATFSTCCFCPLRTKTGCHLPIHCSAQPVWSKAGINLSAWKGKKLKSPGCRGRVEQTFGVQM